MRGQRQRGSVVAVVATGSGPFRVAGPFSTEKRAAFELAMNDLRRGRGAVADSDRRNRARTNRDGRRSAAIPGGWANYGRVRNAARTRARWLVGALRCRVGSGYLNPMIALWRFSRVDLAGRCRSRGNRLIGLAGGRDSANRLDHFAGVNKMAVCGRRYRDGGAMKVLRSRAEFARISTVPGCVSGLDAGFSVRRRGSGGAIWGFGADQAGTPSGS